MKEKKRKTVIAVVFLVGLVLFISIMVFMYSEIQKREQQRQDRIDTYIRIYKFGFNY